MRTNVYDYLKKWGEVFCNSYRTELSRASIFCSGSYRCSCVGEYLYRRQPEELYEGETSGEAAEQPADEMSNELSGLHALGPRVQRESKWIQLN